MTLDEVIEADKPASCRSDGFLFVYHSDVLDDPDSEVYPITVSCLNCITCTDVLDVDDPDVPQNGWEHYDAG